MTRPSAPATSNRELSLLTGDGSATSLSVAQGRVTTPAVRPPARSDARRRIRAAHFKLIVGAVAMAIIVLPIVLAPLLHLQDPLKQDLTHRLASPGTAHHLFGTDQLGRDLMSRMIYGGRISLTIGVLAVVLSGIIGLVAGTVAGFYGGIVDTVISRVLEAQLALPLLMLLLLVIALFGPSITVLSLVLALAQWPEPARMARSLTLVEREKPYIDAGRLVGCRRSTLLLRHIVPNILSQVLVVVLLLLAQAVLLESSLSYLGLGVTRPNPTWGRIISDGQVYVTTSWWVVTIPGLAISLLVVGVNMFGEGLRELISWGN